MYFRSSPSFGGLGFLAQSVSTRWLLFCLGALLLAGGSNLNAAPFRRPLSPTTPMWLVHVQHTTVDHPQDVIEAMPADIRPYVVLNLAMSSAFNDGYEVADAWLNTAAQYGMYAMMQPSSGINNSMSHTDIAPYEALYKKYPNLIGFNFCEQAWGFDAGTFATRLELYAKLLELAEKYGGYLYINDNFSLSNAPWNYISKLKTSARFRDTTRLYKDNFIVGNKYTQSYGYYDNEGGTFGAFLSGHAGHYAVRFDQFAWGWSGKAQVFGTEYPDRAEFGANTLFSCPESVAGVPIVEQMILNGASVIDGPEIPAIANVYKGLRTPMFNNMIADILRKALDGTIRIPALSEVAQRTKVAFVVSSGTNPPADLYTGLYEMDGQRSQNRTWFKKTGRYPTIPSFFTSAAYETSLVPTYVASADYLTRWPNQQAKVDEFNSLYPQESTGDMFVARVANKWYSYNPYINTDVAASASVPLKYNTCSELGLSYTAHTFAVITENAESLNVYLNNYRTDKSSIWQTYPSGIGLFSATFDSYLLNSYIPAPVDTPLRESVLQVRGALVEPTYTLVDRGTHRPSTAVATWAEGVYTLKVSHNGPVDVSIQCAGTAAGRPVAPAPVTVTPPAAPGVFTMNPYALNRAAGYGAKSGITTQFCSEGGLNVTSISNGDWICMRNVDFGAGASYFLGRIAGTPGGSIQLRAGSVDGPLMGTCVVPATAGAQIWKTVFCPVDGNIAKGAMDLFLVFTGGSGTSLFNVNWFQFEALGSAPAVPSDLLAQPTLDGRILLTWSGGSSVGTFTIRRALNSGGPYVTVASDVPQASYTDGDVNLGFTYYYVVSKVASGQESALSSEAQGSAVRTRMPLADAYVRDGGSANTNFGTVNELPVKLDTAGFVRESFLQFDVTGLGDIASAKLRLTPVSGATDSGTALSYEFVAVDSWTESGITWNTKPAGSGTVLGTRTGYTLLSPVKIDVAGKTQAEAAGDGRLSLRIFATVAGSNKIVGFASREHGEAAYRPALEYLLAGPAAPADVKAVLDSGSVSITWMPSPGALSYVVKCATSKGGPYRILAANLTSTSYADPDVADGEVYYYVVCGVNAENQGAGSPELALAVGQARPRAHLRFDDASGNRAADSSGNAWDGDLINGPAWLAGSNARINGALSFDGVNDHVVLPAGVMNGLADFTVSTWVRLESVSTWSRIFDFGFGSGGNTMYLTPRATSSTGPVRFGIRVGSTSQVIEGKSALPAGEWVHVAVTLSGTTGTLYVNGEAVGTNPTMTFKPSSVGVTTLNYLGRSQSTADPYLRGALDEFKIFGRALLPSEVARLANPPPPPVITSATTAAGKYNAAFTYGITATNTPTSFTATALPSGLLVDSSTGVISGTPSSAGEYSVQLGASNDGGTGAALLNLTIAKAAALVSISNLQHVYDGSPKAAVVTTAPSGLALTVTYDGVAQAPVNAGTYKVDAKVVDPNYAGAGSAFLEITKATAQVGISGLTRAYDGAPKPVTTVTQPANLAVAVTYDGSADPSVYPDYHDVVATVQDLNYTGSASARLLITISALVRHAPQLNGLVDGSAQMLLGEALMLQGSATVAGDLLVPGTPAVVVNGSPTYVGQKTGPGSALPANYSVTLNSGSVLRYLVSRVDPIDLPAVATPPRPSGTRSVTIDRATDPVGDFGTLRHLTLNSGAGSVVVPPGVYGQFTVNNKSALVLGVPGSSGPVEYAFESLTLNGNQPIKVVGEVIITVAGGISLNGTVGEEAHPEWLTLRFSSGGLSLNSGATFYGVIVAPSGTVTINGNTSVHGRIMADRLMINSNGSLKDPSLP